MEKLFVPPSPPLLSDIYGGNSFVGCVVVVKVVSDWTKVRRSQGKPLFFMLLPEYMRKNNGTTTEWQWLCKGQDTHQGTKYTENQITVSKASVFILRPTEGLPH